MAMSLAATAIAGGSAVHWTASRQRLTVVAPSRSAAGKGGVPSNQAALRHLPASYLTDG